MSQPTITMYVREGCHDVARAQHILRERGLHWDEIDIEQDADARAKVMGWTGRAATPTLFIGDTMLVEPGATEIDNALAQAAQ